MNPKLKTCGKKTQPAVLNLNLDHNVGPDLCCKMVSGIIKHVLYHRGQIPEPFDQLLKTCATLEKSKTENVTNVVGARTRQKEVQLCKLAKTFSELFAHLETIFLNAEKRNVRRIAVILGSTPVTPREIHCIELPVDICWDHSKRRQPLADQTTSRHCLSQMFRTLYTTSNAVVWPSISPANLTVLVEMERDCKVDWFLPKSSYSLPERGHTVLYRIKANVPGAAAPVQNGINYDSVLGCHTSNTKTQFDIYKSPHVKLPISNCAPTGLVANCPSIINGICNLSLAETRIPMESESMGEENYIWFQMPISAKGFAN